jgi:hypothetical protein
MRRTLHALFLLAVAAGGAAGTGPAIEATPSDSMTQGKVAVDLGDLAAAEKVFAALASGTAASERGRAEAQVRLGVVQRALGKTQASAAAFQRAIDSRARDSEVTRLLALALAGVAPDRRTWATLWPRVRFTAQSRPAARQPSIHWPGVPPQDVRALFPATVPVTFDLEDVPLNAFLHHFLVPWRPGVQSARTWPGPGAEDGYGFDSWPAPFEPPAAIQRLDFVIHSGVEGRLAGGSTDALGPRVTVKASGMPWSELFENVLASNGLGFVIDNNVLFIARAEDLTAFDRVRGRRYSDLPISLNFLDGNLRDVFRLLADVTGFELVPDEELPGSFTTVVTERPAMEVFDLLLAANDLAATRIPAPDRDPAATALRIRRLAAVGGDAVDVSQLRPVRRTLSPRPGFVERAGPASTAPEPSGQLVFIEGVVQVKKAGTFRWTAAQQGMQLSLGDLVRTGADAGADIRWADGTAFHLKEHSLVAVEGRPEAGKVKVISAPGQSPRND